MLSAHQKRLGLLPTCLEEIDAGLVTPDVEVIFKQSLRLESQLSEIVAPVISE